MVAKPPITFVQFETRRLEAERQVALSTARRLARGYGRRFPHFVPVLVHRPALEKLLTTDGHEPPAAAQPSRAA